MAASSRSTPQAVLPALGILVLSFAGSCDDEPTAEDLCDRYKELTEKAGCTYQDCDGRDDFEACPAESEAVLDCWEAALSQCDCKSSGELDCEGVACDAQYDALDACKAQN